MTERERFEKWAKQEGYRDVRPDTECPWRYPNDELETAWQAWQAALESRVLAEKKPVAWRVHPFDYGIGHEGVYAMTMRDEQVLMWERKGWKVEPLFNHPTPDDVRDAARYRWLRKEHFQTADNPPLAQVVWKLGGNRHGGEWANLIDGNDLDAAIDRARQSGEESNGNG